MLVTVAQTLIPAGVVLGQIGAVIFLIALVFDRQNLIVRWVGSNAMWLATLFLVVAVAGSLFYSEVVGFAPCTLCWWQRIFIYPQLVLFLVALKHKTRDIFTYSLHLSVIGALIAIYHIFLPYLEAAGFGCGTTGPSCTKLYVLAFGYVTIPVMSLTAFVILILIAISNLLKTRSEAKQYI